MSYKSYRYSISQCIFYALSARSSVWNSLYTLAHSQWSTLHQSGLILILYNRGLIPLRVCDVKLKSGTEIPMRVSTVNRSLQDSRIQTKAHPLPSGKSDQTPTFDWLHKRHWIMVLNKLYTYIQRLIDTVSTLGTDSNQYCAKPFSYPSFVLFFSFKKSGFLVLCFYCSAAVILRTFWSSFRVCI